MKDKFRIRVKDLQIGSRFSMSPHDREILTVKDLDDDVAYCDHFFGVYVLPAERFVYMVNKNENSLIER